MRTYNILLINQDNFYQRIIDLALTTLGITCKLSSVTDCAEARTIPRDIPCDLLIADLEDMGPSELFEIAGEFIPPPPVLIFSAESELNKIVDSFRGGARDYLLKPCAINELAERLRNCLMVSATKEKRRPITDRPKNQKKQACEMQATMAHDLRSPIISTQAGIKHLRLGSFGWMEREVACQLDKLDARCYKLLDMTNEYLALIFKPGKGKPPRRHGRSSDNVPNRNNPAQRAQTIEAHRK